MLIFISDLHLIDETVGKHNIPISAYKGVFEDIKRYNKNISEVKLVFLGDTFDIIRTTFWSFHVPAGERPWGDITGNSKLVEEHAGRILDDVISKNTEVLAFIKDGLREIFQMDVEKIYIPGNHDRLCNVYGSLRKKVRDSLGIKGFAEPFEHKYDDAVHGNKYKVFARHGHEFDPWNYEGTADYTDEDYARVPIGDLIVSEIIARIPYTVMKYVGNSVPPEQKEDLLRNLQEVDNVRPAAAVLNWLFFQVSQKPRLKNAINKSVEEISANLLKLPYFQEWYDKHGGIFSLGMAAELKAALKIAERFNFGSADKMIDFLKKIPGSGAIIDYITNSEKKITSAAMDFLKNNPGYRSFLLGHTHNPLQMPACVNKNGMGQIYINTGTWREKYVQGSVGGFIGLKYLTYCVFYTPEENLGQPYETWTGALKEEVIS